MELAPGSFGMDLAQLVEGNPVATIVIDAQHRGASAVHRGS
jgi:hypothetical protein